MASIITPLAKTLHSELLSRGWCPPSIEECEEIARAMIEQTAKIAEKVEALKAPPV